MFLHGVDDDEILADVAREVGSLAGPFGPSQLPAECAFKGIIRISSSDLVLTHNLQNRATSGLIELMKLYPPSTHFFINSWTWGYEDILKAIARAFNTPVSPLPLLLFFPSSQFTQIHLDRYKHGIFKCLSDPFLRRIATSDPAATRFHACERFDRCDHVAVDDEVGKARKVISRLGKRVVYVNPVSMDEEKWDEYLTEHKALLEKGETPSVMVSIALSLARHYRTYILANPTP